MHNFDLAQLRRVLTEHFSRYPAMCPRDAVKLCYQAVYGGGHLITDEKAALAYLHTERASVRVKTCEQTDAPFCEDIGCGMARLHLAAPECQALSDAAILKVFMASAKRRFSQLSDGSCAFSDDRMEAALSVLGSLVNEKAAIAPFSKEELTEYLTEYRASGCPAVHHSDAYRNAYAPAYRVIEKQYGNLFSLIEAIDRCLLASERPVLVAIDGRAASGKTTIADAIGALYDCNVFHMDDYFLPFDLRTEARFNEAGGNVHYERFQSEILYGIQSGKPFSYRPFDCAAGTFSEPVSVVPKRLSIIEGAYALHPYFQNPYDIRAAVTVHPATQKARILRRNGEKMLDRFTSVWIPMEEAYFDAFRVFENADIVISNDGDSV